MLQGEKLVALNSVPAREMQRSIALVTRGVVGMDMVTDTVTIAIRMRLRPGGRGVIGGEVICQVRVTRRRILGRVY